MPVVTIYSFRLFVAGATQRSTIAEANLRELCESRLAGDYQIDVVDVTERPELAEQHRILATPAVLRLSPLPRRQVVGDLSDRRRTAYALGLPERPDAVGGREEE